MIKVLKTKFIDKDKRGINAKLSNIYIYVYIYGVSKVMTTP